MTTVIAAFCAAAGIPDPYAVLVERARADAETFRRETGNLLDVVGLAAYKRDPLYEIHARLEMWLAREKGDSRKVAHLLWRTRAMSEALGGELGPTGDEERSIAYRWAKASIEVSAGLNSAALAGWKRTDPAEVARQAGARFAVAGPADLVRARALVAELTGVTDV